MGVVDAAGLGPGVVVAEKLELVRQLARGGMGAVWVAHHRALDIRVAVKFMAGEHVASAELRARFEQEARAAARLSSRHVVRILDTGIDRGLPFIVMELLAGEDLSSRMKRRGWLDLQETGVMLRQIAKGLTAAHDAGIVHRDLKPANVFLAHQDGEEVVKLLDFGVAKMPVSADRDATDTGVVVGSPNYLSPEQARSSRLVDHRADLWSLGVILFRCVTGHLPFNGDTPTDVIVQICTAQPAIPSMILPELPGPIDEFFERALCREPEGRFQSAAEMCEAFDYSIGAGSRGAGLATADTSVNLAVTTRPGQPSSLPTRASAALRELDGSTAAASSQPIAPSPPRVPVWSWLAAIVGTGSLAVGGVALYARLTSSPPADQAAAPAVGTAATGGSEPVGLADAHVAEPSPPPANPAAAHEPVMAVSPAPASATSVPSTAASRSSPPVTFPVGASALPAPPVLPTPPPEDTFGDSRR